VIFKKAIPTAEVYDLGQWLVAGWKQLGLSQQPEVFPKQRQLDDATKFGNWVRFPGRHHTHNFWSQVWNGKKWLKGNEAIDVILAATGVSRKTVLDLNINELFESACGGAEKADNAGLGFLTGDADLDQFAPLLRNVKKSKNGYTASCPCPDHPDKHPSFSFRKSAEGRIQFICFRGCKIDKINDAINKLRIANGAGNGTDVVCLMTELDREKFNRTLRKLNKLLIKALTPTLLNELSDNLSIPVDALLAFDAGWSEQYKCWSFPMRDASGTIIGIAYRRRKGEKFVHPGSVPGLFMAQGWKDLKGTIFVPEGVSDAAAMLAMGISVIGRFNNSEGAEMLAEVCKQLKCEAVIVGDNDSKRDGSWPGLQAKELADKLARLLGREVKWALPPEGNKDVRSWLINQGVNDD
ncbi:MAG TPA: hypothetical protein PLX97_12240, partial [Gemmatales bacterium]|nr:hypothetical protein [Gemmatales bacterium]